MLSSDCGDAIFENIPSLGLFPSPWAILSYTRRLFSVFSLYDNRKKNYIPVTLQFSCDLDLLAACFSESQKQLQVPNGLVSISRIVSTSALGAIATPTSLSLATMLGEHNMSIHETFHS
jgi:hypothetical protein